MWRSCLGRPFGRAQSSSWFGGLVLRTVPGLLIWRHASYMAASDCVALISWGATAGLSRRDRGTCPPRQAAWPGAGSGAFHGTGGASRRRAGLDVNPTAFPLVYGFPYAWGRAIHADKARLCDLWKRELVMSRVNRDKTISGIQCTASPVTLGIVHHTHE